MKTRIKVISTTAVTVAGCAGLTGGIASAATISTTGPGSYNQVSSSYDTSSSTSNNNNIFGSNGNNQSANTGSVRSYGNTNAGGYGGGLGYGTGIWSDYDPITAQANGMQFGDWYSHMLQEINSYNGIDWSNGTATANLGWQPTGDNWQASWSNYDPMLWQQNGQSYGNWYNQMLNHLTSNFNTMMNGWNATGSGSGDASNTNDSGFNVNASNSTDGVGANGTAGAGFGNGEDGMIYLTGPNSTNIIDSDYSSDYDYTNTNMVGLSNNNTQNASSGDVTSNGNTIGGYGSSGAAYNQNSSHSSVSL